MERIEGDETTERSGEGMGGPYHRLVDDLTDGVFRLDADGSFEAVNEAFAELAGRERSALRGTNFGVAFSETATERIDGLLRSLVSADDADTDTISVDVRTADGGTVRCELRVSVIAEDGSLAGASGILRRQADTADESNGEDPDAVFDRLTDAVFALDREGKFTYVNDRAERVLGEPESELLDTVAWELFSGSRRAQFEQHCEEALRTQEPTAFEEFNPDLETWFDVRIHPSESGVSVHFRDITERKEQEAELNEREQRLVMLAESLTEIVWMASPDGEEIVFINSAYEDVWGRETDELHDDAMAFLEGVHPEDRDRVREAFGALPEEEYDETFRVVQPDGTVRWVESHGSAVENDQGEVVRIVGTAQDITERRQAQQALRERERQLSTLMSNVPGMVYRRRGDDGWPMEFVSEGCTDLTGYDPETLEDGSVVWGEDVVVAEDRADHREEIMAHVESRESFAVTYRIETAAGETRWVREQGRGVFDDGTLESLEGVVTDVTERVQYERTLERREQRLRETYDIIADNDRSFEAQLDGLLEVGREVTDAEYAALGRIHDDEYVFDSVIAPDGDVEPGDVVPLSTRVCERTADEESSLRLDDIKAEAPDLVDRGGYEASDVNCYLGAPVFVDGEVYGVLCFYGPEGGEGRFTEWQSTFADIMSRWIGTELETKRHTEQLAALNELNGVVRGVSDAVIDQSTREEIEEITCQRLAESDSYQFAWLGEPNTKTQRIEPRAEVGAEGYLDDIEFSVDPDAPESDGPTAAALRSGDIETVRNVQSDPDYEPWQAAAEERGFRAAAAVPVVHEETTYGVLNVYTERNDAFEREERVVLEHLGELVGHAIAAVERKRALMTDEIVELEFAASNVFARRNEDLPEGTVSFDRSIPTGDGQYLVYATADGDVVDSLETVADAIPLAESITTIETTGEGTYQLHLSEPPVISTIASLGGAVERAVMEDGDFRMTVHVPSGTDVRQVIDTVQEALPQAEPLARRQVPHADSSAGSGVNTDLDIDLTERQRAAVEAAYFAGFFEWPRDSSGEEVAESLDITSPTFHQHVRAAENKVFSALFDG
ncbi:PAS domain S-box protein [Natronomonas halophila]|uniref:PAS domain S-box protein n=1 Tax=Natronomonas halophila TaxID=2747817 RepID=UPI0015B6B5FB|nr:PAS domain S-box protein [Natronomonas halophila]QLD87029.1 PAS domain S-box protein [Natronomonas halophila]